MIRFETKPPVIKYVLEEMLPTGFNKDDAIELLGELMGLMVAHNCITVTPAPDADTLADDLALAWISKHTKIEIDSPPYRELVRAFLQMRTPAPDVDAVDKLQRANHLLSGSANLLHADIDKGNEMIAALVEALRPFAACAEVWEGDDPDWILHRSRSYWPGKPDLNITVGDLQRAAAALASVEGGE